MDLFITEVGVGLDVNGGMKHILMSMDCSNIFVCARHITCIRHISNKWVKIQVSIYIENLRPTYGVQANILAFLHKILFTEKSTSISIEMIYVGSIPYQSLLNPSPIHATVQSKTKKC